MAPAALLIWPLIAIVIFARWRIEYALILAVLIPYLFLPEAYEIALPGLPDLDKTTTISLGLVLAFFLSRKARQTANVPDLRQTARFYRWLEVGLVLVLIMASIPTVLNNREALSFGLTVLPGLRLWDAVDMVASIVIPLVPYLLARRYLAAPEMHRILLTAFVLAGLFYSLLMLIELRISPQLHIWVYGYFQHSFLQHIRGGYRPIVFLQHGLWVGFFIFTTVLAAASLWKAGHGTRWFLAALWLFVILAISKNLGALAIAVILLALFFGSPRWVQVWALISIASIVLLYPVMQQAKLIPVTQITTLAAKISEDRAASLQYRLDNEDRLLNRALNKPITGWGGWGRDRIYDDRGNDISVSEGRWIQTIGTRGWLGYFGLFGLLTCPIFFLRQAARRKPVPVETIALAFILAGNLIYMIPNSTLTPVGWMTIGALVGFLQNDLRILAGDTADLPKERSPTKYTRFSK